MEESVSELIQIGEAYACRGKETQARLYSPLTLAYIGEAVYDLVIRTVVVERGNKAANLLHRSTVKYVKAGAQAAVADALQDCLTQEELSVYRRGRNAKSHTMAKNASVADYRKATGLEALIGYLYLSDRFGRVLELMKLGMEKAGQEI